MELGVLIPTRGERIELLELLTNHMLPNQTLQPDKVALVDTNVLSVFSKIKSDQYERMMLGLESLQECAYVAVMEDDDYYPPDYLESLARHFSPETELIGYTESIYYNVRTRRWRHHEHKGRASMFQTCMTQKAASRMMRARFLDITLWYQTPQHEMKELAGWKAIGIKHGIGLQGGSGHRLHLDHADPKGEWLKSRVTEEAWDVYQRMQT